MELVEATPDRLWGCGATLSTDVLRGHQWVRQNRHGKILMTVREELRRLKSVAPRVPVFFCVLSNVSVLLVCCNVLFFICCNVVSMTLSFFSTNMSSLPNIEFCYCTWVDGCVLVWSRRFENSKLQRFKMEQFQSFKWGIYRRVIQVCFFYVNLYTWIIRTPWKTLRVLKV